MAVTFADLTVDPQTLVDADPTSPVRIIVRTNTGGAIIDSAANKIFLGTYSVDTETTATISLPVTNGATNPTNFQYAVDLEYVDAATRTRKTWSSGWFSFTAAANLASIAAEQYVPPTWMTTAVTTLQGYVTTAEAARDATVTISGLTGEDAAVGALIKGTAGAGPITRAALSASYVGKPTTDLGDWALLRRDTSDVTKGVAWTTPHIAVARVLGWAVVTDAQYAGGADPTGVADSLAASQAAHDSLPASGGTLYYPAGTYKHSAAVAITKTCSVVGTGYTSKIKTTSATANIFTVSAGLVTIRHLDMTSTVTRTAGWYVDILSTASNTRVENFTMAGAIGGVRTAATGVVIARGSIRDGTAGTGVAVRVDGGFAVAIEDITTDAAAQTFAGIHVTNVGDLVIRGCQLIHAGTGLNVVVPTGSSVTSLWVESTFFDNCTLGVSLDAAGGTIARTSFLRCWMSSASQWGAKLSTSGGGTIDGTDFLGCHIFLNGSGGVLLNDTGVSNTRIEGGAICANTGNAGVLVNAAVAGLSIQGAKIGDGYGLGGNGYGIFFQAAATTGATKVQITDNDFNGNTVTAIAGVPGLRDDVIIKDNLGFASKSATAAIAVTASPFTYTAGNHFETVYINGGTVSLVKVEGVSVFTGTNCSVRLGPGKSVEVTYTAAPGMVATKGG